MLPKRVQIQRTPTSRSRSRPRVVPTILPIPIAVKLCLDLGIELGLYDSRLRRSPLSPEEDADEGGEADGEEDGEHGVAPAPAVVDSRTWPAGRRRERLNTPSWCE